MPQRALRLAERSEIGDAIRTARHEVGKSQAQLAIDVDAAASTIIQWELGVKHPSGPFLARLILALPDHADELIRAAARSAVPS